MRIVVGLFAVVLGASVAVADDAPAPTPAPTVAATAKKAPPLRVVRVMPESKQALLFDKAANKHVLVEVDGTIAGYTVTEIEDDEVTLLKDGSELVLAAPMRRGDRTANADAPAPTPKAKTAAPSDPYADDGKKPEDPYGAKEAPSKPEDPYAEKPVRVVKAPEPINAGDHGIRVADAPKADAPKADAPKTDAPKVADAPKDAKVEAPSPTPTPSPAKTTPPKGEPAPAAPSVDGLVLTKAAFKAELANFGKLANGVKATFVSSGVRIDSVVAGSLFDRAGLAKNDVVLAVNDSPLRSIDDAADLYARASSTTAISISVMRSGKPMTLRVTIQ